MEKNNAQHETPQLAHPVSEKKIKKIKNFIKDFLLFLDLCWVFTTMNVTDLYEQMCFYFTIQ